MSMLRYKKSKNNQANINFIKKFFWFCAGANVEILSQEDCKTEHDKYSSIGMAVFLTAIMAFLSGGYALYTVFRSIFPSVSFGFLWSVIIFNLDRSIVLNIRKKRNYFWEPIIASSPRLLLAVALGFVIAKPLELQLFSREINQRILAEKDARIAEVQRKVREDGTAETQLRLNEIIQLSTEIETKTSELSKQNNNLTWGLKERGEDLATQNRRRQVSQLEADIKALRERKEVLEQELANLTKSALDNEVKEVEEEYMFSDGFPKQLEVLENLSAENPRIAIINWSITGLFILIEILPIIVKLMSKYGPYDAIVEAEEETAIFRQSVRTEDIKEKILQDRKDNQNIRVQISTFLDKEFIRILKEVLDQAEYTRVLRNTMERRVGGTLSGYSKFITNEVTGGMKQPTKEAEELLLRGLDEEIQIQTKIKDEVLQVFNYEIQNFRDQAKRIIEDYDQIVLMSEEIDLDSLENTVGEELKIVENYPKELGSKVNIPPTNLEVDVFEKVDP